MLDMLQHGSAASHKAVAPIMATRCFSCGGTTEQGVDKDNIGFIRCTPCFTANDAAFSATFRGANWHHLTAHQPSEGELLKALNLVGDINGTLTADHITVELSTTPTTMVVLTAGPVTAEALFELVKDQVPGGDVVIRIQKTSIPDWDAKVAEFAGIVREQPAEWGKSRGGGEL